MKKLGAAIRRNKTEFIILSLILLVGAFLRFYKIDQYLTFLGDEGRDVLLVRRFLVEGDIFLIGPGTSIGNMYLGPLYYYLIAPFLWVANYSPVGPAAMIAGLGVVTIAFVWWVGREFFGKHAAIVASLLYAISPTVIIYSRSSWNPNIMPFFALLCVYSLWRVYSKNQPRWLLVLGVSFAFVLQSHYLGLVLAPTLAVYWFLSLIKVWRNKDSRVKFILNSFFGFAIFLLLMSPLAIFDARHNWQNLEAIKKFFFERQTTVSARPWNALPVIWPELKEISTRLVGGRSMVFGEWVALFLAGGSVFALVKNRLGSKKSLMAFVLLLVWLGMSLVGLGLYKQHIYDHYYGFFFVVPFLLLGGISQAFINQSKIRGVWIVATVIVFAVYFNLQENPLRSSPNNQMGRTRQAADRIIELADGRPLNLAVLAERNYEDAYQYFLEARNVQVLEINPQELENTLAQQLFVVCELPEEKCDPVHSPKTEIANFGWSVVESKENVAGVILYKLVHSE